MTALVLGCGGRESSTCAEGYERVGDRVCELVGGSDSGGLNGDHRSEEDSGEWLLAPEACEAPTDLPIDPVVRTHHESVSGFAHVLDVAYSDVDAQFYVAGLPALTAWRVTAAGVEETARYDMETTNHVTVLGAGRVAVSRRGDSMRGGMVEVLAVDEGEVAVLSNIPVDDAAGMAAAGDLLYILAASGALYTYDISDLERPLEVHQLSGLGNPWELQVVGSYAYVADNALGLVTVDLADPRAPTVVGEPASGAGLQDVTVANGYAYGAAGSRGVYIYDLTEPSDPEEVAQVEPGGGIISVAWANDVLWTANQVGVAAVDVRHPRAPVALGSKATDSWAMAVATSGSGAFLAGWNEVAVYQADRDERAPDAQPDLSALYYPDGTEEQRLKLHNEGSASLEIVGLSADVEDIEIRLDTLTVPPGESASIQVRWMGSGDVSGALCIATNDPDEPVQTLQILTSNDDSSVLIGEPAPDFALVGVDGATYTLSEQRGRPVVLIYFDAW